MEKFTFFYRSHSPFSQWYPSDFVVDGLEFNCAEQYMMLKKAQLFGDEEAALKIMQAPTPREQKARGRSVRGFDQSLWRQIAGNLYMTVITPSLHKIRICSSTCLKRKEPLWLRLVRPTPFGV